MRFRFVGSESHAGQVRINRFGQALDLDEQTAHDCLLSRVALVTEEEWKSAGLTEDEEDYFGEYTSHTDAPAAFNAKKAKLHALASRRILKYAKEAEAGRSYIDHKDTKPSTSPAPVKPAESAPPAAPTPDPPESH